MENIHSTGEKATLYNGTVATEASENQIDYHNNLMYKSPKQRDCNKYICIRCREATSLDASGSNHYYNLHCNHCINELARSKDITYGHVIAMMSEGKEKFDEFFNN